MLVIALGPGGEEVASRLADAGLTVLGVERQLVGGECPYWGCIPSKMIVRATETLAEGRRVDQLAGAVQVCPDYAPVAHRIRSEATDNWDDTVAVARFEKHGGRFVRGQATLVGPDRVQVGETVFTASPGMVMATGSAPVRPPIPGLAEAGYWTNREAIGAEYPPPSLVMLGGGAIGWNWPRRWPVRLDGRRGAGCRSDAAGGGAGIQCGDRRVLEAEGLALRTGRRAVAVSRSGGRHIVTLDDGWRPNLHGTVFPTFHRGVLGALADLPA